MCIICAGFLELCSVVGGLETLDKMEKIETDAKDRPKVRKFQDMFPLFGFFY